MQPFDHPLFNGEVNSRPIMDSSQLSGCNLQGPMATSGNLSMDKTNPEKPCLHDIPSSLATGIDKPPDTDNYGCIKSHHGQGESTGPVKDTNSGMDPQTPAPLTDPITLAKPSDQDAVASEASTSSPTPETNNNQTSNSHEPGIVITNTKEPEAFAAHILASSGIKATSVDSSPELLSEGQSKGTTSPEAKLASRLTSNKAFIEKSRLIAENVVLGPSTSCKRSSAVDVNEGTLSTLMTSGHETSRNKNSGISVDTSGPQIEGIEEQLSLLVECTTDAVNRSDTDNASLCHQAENNICQDLLEATAGNVQRNTQGYSDNRDHISASLKENDPASDLGYCNKGGTENGQANVLPSVDSVKGNMTSGMVSAAKTDIESGGSCNKLLGTVTPDTGEEIYQMSSFEANTGKSLTLTEIESTSELSADVSAQGDMTESHPAEGFSSEALIQRSPELPKDCTSERQHDLDGQAVSKRSTNQCGKVSMSHENTTSSEMACKLNSQLCRIFEGDSAAVQGNALSLVTGSATTQVDTPSVQRNEALALVDSANISSSKEQTSQLCISPHQNSTVLQHTGTAADPSVTTQMGTPSVQRNETLALADSADFSSSKEQTSQLCISSLQNSAVLQQTGTEAGPSVTIQVDTPSVQRNEALELALVDSADISSSKEQTSQLCISSLQNNTVLQQTDTEADPSVTTHVDTPSVQRNGALELTLVDSADISSSKEQTSQLCISSPQNSTVLQQTGTEVDPSVTIQVDTPSVQRNEALALVDSADISSSKEQTSQLCISAGQNSTVLQQTGTEADPSVTPQVDTPSVQRNKALTLDSADISSSKEQTSALCFSSLQNSTVLQCTGTEADANGIPGERNVQCTESPQETSDKIPKQQSLQLSALSQDTDVIPKATSPLLTDPEAVVTETSPKEISMTCSGSEHISHTVTAPPPPLIPDATKASPTVPVSNNQDAPEGSLPQSSASVDGAGQVSILDVLSEIADQSWGEQDEAWSSRNVSMAAPPTLAEPSRPPQLDDLSIPASEHIPVASNISFDYSIATLLAEENDSASNHKQSEHDNQPKKKPQNDHTAAETNTTTLETTTQKDLNNPKQTESQESSLTCMTSATVNPPSDSSWIQSTISALSEIISRPNDLTPTSTQNVLHTNRSECSSLISSTERPTTLSYSTTSTLPAMCYSSSNTNCVQSQPQGPVHTQFPNQHHQSVTGGGFDDLGLANSYVERQLHAKQNHPRESPSSSISTSNQCRSSLNGASSRSFVLNQPLGYIAGMQQTSLSPNIQQTLQSSSIAPLIDNLDSLYNISNWNIPTSVPDSIPPQCVSRSRADQLTHLLTKDSPAYMNAQLGYGQSTIQPNTRETPASTNLVHWHGSNGMNVPGREAYGQFHTSSLRNPHVPGQQQLPLQPNIIHPTSSNSNEQPPFHSTNLFDNRNVSPGTNMNLDAMLQMQRQLPGCKPRNHHAGASPAIPISQPSRRGIPLASLANLNYDSQMRANYASSVQPQRFPVPAPHRHPNQPFQQGYNPQQMQRPGGLMRPPHQPQTGKSPPGFPQSNYNQLQMPQQQLQRQVPPVSIEPTPNPRWGPFRQPPSRYQNAQQMSSPQQPTVRHTVPNPARNPAAVDKYADRTRNRSPQVSQPSQITTEGSSPQSATPSSEPSGNDSQSLAALVVASVLKGYKSDQVEQQIRLVNELLKNAGKTPTANAPATDPVSAQTSGSISNQSAPLPRVPGVVSQSSPAPSVSPAVSSGLGGRRDSAESRPPSSGGSAPKVTPSNDTHTQKPGRPRPSQPIFVDLTEDENTSAAAPAKNASLNGSAMAQLSSRTKKENLDIHIFLEVVNVKSTKAQFCVLERCMWGTCRPRNVSSFKLSHGWWILQSEKTKGCPRNEDVAYVAAQIIARSQHDKQYFREQMTQILYTDIGRRCSIFRAISTDRVKVVGRSFVRPRNEAGDLFISLISTSLSDKPGRQYLQETSTDILNAAMVQFNRRSRARDENTQKVVVIAPLSNATPQETFEESTRPAPVQNRPLSVEERLDLESRAPIVIQPPPTPAPVTEPIVICPDDDQVPSVAPIIIEPPPTPAMPSQTTHELPPVPVNPAWPVAVPVVLNPSILEQTPIVIAPPPTPRPDAPVEKTREPTAPAPVSSVDSIPAKTTDVSRPSVVPQPDTCERPASATAPPPNETSDPNRDLLGPIQNFVDNFLTSKKDTDRAIAAPDSPSSTPEPPSVGKPPPPAHCPTSSRAVPACDPGRDVVTRSTPPSHVGVPASVQDKSNSTMENRVGGDAQHTSSVTASTASTTCAQETEGPQDLSQKSKDPSKSSAHVNSGRDVPSTEAHTDRNNGNTTAGSQSIMSMAQELKRNRGSREDATNHLQQEYISLDDFIDISCDPGRDKCASVTSSVDGDKRETQTQQQMQDHLVALLFDTDTKSAEGVDKEGPRQLRVKLTRIEGTYRSLGLEKRSNCRYKILESSSYLKPIRSNRKRLFNTDEETTDNDHVDPEWEPDQIGMDADDDNDHSTDEMESSTDAFSDSESDASYSVGRVRRSRLSSTDDERSPYRSRIRTRKGSTDDTSDTNLRTSRRKRRRLIMSDSDDETPRPKVRVTKRRNVIDSDDEFADIPHPMADPIFPPSPGGQSPRAKGTHSSPTSGSSSVRPIVSSRTPPPTDALHRSTGPTIAASKNVNVNVLQPVVVMERLTEGHILKLKSKIKRGGYKGSIQRKPLEFCQKKALAGVAPGKVSSSETTTKNSVPKDSEIGPKVKCHGKKLKGCELTLEFFTNDQLWQELQCRQNLITCVCGMTFLDHMLYSTHRQTHDAQNPKKCAICSEEFEEWIQFTSHSYGRHCKKS